MQPELPFSRSNRHRNQISEPAESRKQGVIRDNMEAEQENAQKTILTYEGLRKYEDELQDLKVNRRKEVAAKLKEARAQGDLSENGEYDAAKDEQRDIETRIAELEKLLKNVEVVDADEISVDKVSFGSKVKIHDVDEDEDLEYQIVGSKEANILQNRISNESPVGKALIGARVGDTVSVETAAGILQYQVLSIERAS